MLGMHWVGYDNGVDVRVRPSIPTASSSFESRPRRCSGNGRPPAVLTGASTVA